MRCRILRSQATGKETKEQIMIKKEPSYITTDGRSFLELRDAHIHEILSLFKVGSGPSPEQIETVTALVDARVFIMEVFKVKARKPRESKVVKVKKRTRKITAPQDEHLIIN